MLKKQAENAREKVKKLSELLKTDKEETRDVKMTIDDSVILDTHEESCEEKLRLVFPFPEGFDIKIRFPTYGMWDKYVEDLGRLLYLLGMTSDRLKKLKILNLDNLDEKQLEIWASIVGIALKMKKVRRTVEKMFFRYLRPTIKEIGLFSSKIRWARKNLEMVHLISMFNAVIAPEDYLKKKSNLLLKKILSQATQSQSSEPSEKQPDGPSKLSTILPSSSFVSFS